MLVMDEVVECVWLIISWVNDLYVNCWVIVIWLCFEVLDVLGLDEVIVEMVKVYNVSYLSCMFIFLLSGEIVGIDLNIVIVVYWIV